MERNSRQRLSVITFLSLTLIACAPATPLGGSLQESSTSSGATAAPILVGTYQVPDAVAMNVATNGVETVVAWIGDGAVRFAEWDPTTSSLIGPTVISGSIEPFEHPIERPGLAVGPDGSIEIAFTGLSDSGGSVFHSTVTGEAVSGPNLVSGEPRPETNLVHIGISDGGETLMAWLEDSTLSVAPTGQDGEPQEIEGVDELTCDCCNPAPVFVGTALLVPYRDYDIVDGRVVRNTVSLRSLDGGATFELPVEVADENWFIDACPFSGPSAVEVDGSVIVAFMDARQSVHPEQVDSSIWVDVSSDGGASFGVDLQVAGEGLNRWPVMAVDDRSVIHLIWEVQGPDGGLAYSSSHDRGTSFSDPLIILAREDTNGPPKAPSIAFSAGALIVTWTDDDGGHVGLIQIN